MNVISIGEVLWDVFGQEEHLGGAPFNFAAHLTRLGHQVSLISAVGDDERGRRIFQAMASLHLSTRYVRRIADSPTGAVSVSLGQAGHPDFIIHRPAAYDRLRLTPEDIQELFARPVDWVYFGTLLQMNPEARRVTMQLLDTGSTARRFYDVNLRAGCWEPELVGELMAKASIVKLNEEEAREVSLMLGEPIESLQKFCCACATRFDWEGICITRGAEGCALLLGDAYVEARGYPAQVVDTVGAGDAFAAALLHGMSKHGISEHGVSEPWPVARIADFANRVGALVASRAGAIPMWTREELESLHPKIAGK